MNEEQIKELILQRFGSINAFSESINIANSTVVSILERGFLNAKLKNVFAICKGLNINPEDLESGFEFVRSANIVHGDNHGVNGLSAGGNSTNTYNFGGNDCNKQDDHNESIRNLSATDVKLQRQILNRFDQQLKIQEETNNLLRMLIDIQEETLDELKLITAPIRKENLKNK